jgi:hypothetical protein
MPFETFGCRSCICKRYVTLGWHDPVSGIVPVSDVLKAGDTKETNLTDSFKPYSVNHRSGREYATVTGGELFVPALIFAREIDDKRYMYLLPFFVLFSGDRPQVVKPDLTSTAGPVTRSCSLDAYAIELAFEFHKRNPLSIPSSPTITTILEACPRLRPLNRGQNPSAGNHQKRVETRRVRLPRLTCPAFDVQTVSSS